MLLRLLSILLFTVVAASAQLRWEKPTQSFDRSPGDPAVEATYAFKNVGPAPITIAKLRSSCGCTAAMLEKRTCAPGESGAITAKFTLGDRRGLHVVGVTVTTDDKSAEPIQLVLRVNIADPLKVEPALVWWRVGAAAEPKVVQLTAESTRPVRVKSVTSTNPRITAKLNTAAAGQRYSLTVVPQDTASKEVAEIRVQTDFPPDAPRSYLIYARVK
jgi:hypothetical protein